MSPPPPKPRSLSVILHRDGACVGARSLPLGQEVRIGPEIEDTFCLPHLSSSHTLTALVDGQTVLVLEGLRGELRHGGRVAALEELWRPDGTLPLQWGEQAVVRLEDAQLTLSLSAAPPEAPPRRGAFRPQLIEPDSGLFLASLALTSALAAALLVFVMTTEPVEGVSLGTIPDRFAQVLLEPALPEPAPNIKPLPPPPPPSPEPIIEPEHPPAGDTELSWGRRELWERSELARRLDEGEPLRGDDGGLPDVEELEWTSMDDAIDPIYAKGYRGSSHRMGDMSISLERGEVGEATLAAVAHSAPEPERWSPQPIEHVPQRGPPSALIKEQVRLYSRRIRSCYERRLKEVPSLSGRMVLEVDIIHGKVAMVKVSEDTAGDAQLAACVLRSARAWRFPDEIDERVVLPFALSSG